MTAVDSLCGRNKPALPSPVRIVGVGSPLGDDAVAWEVVKSLQDRLVSFSDIECHRVEGGQGLLDLLDGRGTLLLVDALASGGAPGTIRCFEWPDDHVETLRPGSTHQVRPAEAMKLGEALGLLPAQVKIYGVEADSFEAQQPLSPKVRAAVPELVERILAELAQSRQG